MTQPLAEPTPNDRPMTRMLLRGLFYGFWLLVGGLVLGTLGLMLDRHLFGLVH